MINVEISNPTNCLLSCKTRKRLKHEMHKNLGKNVCNLLKIPIENEENPGLNRCAIYTEIKGHDPKSIFKDVITWGTNYFFGMIEIKRTHQKVFFLADIENPLPVAKENIIIMPGLNKIIIHVK